MHLLIELFINGAVIFLLAHIIPSVEIKNYGTAISVALVIWILNVKIKIKTMNQIKNVFFVFLLTACIGSSACRNKQNPKNTPTTTVDSSGISTDTVQIATDEFLQNGVRDATKDYPGVTASVNNGEITLTGNIAKERLPKLMQSLNTLHPKKINNNLIIK